jgi:hypothetical protein
MIFINYLKKWIQTILVKLNKMLNGVVYKLKSKIQILKIFI